MKIGVAGLGRMGSVICALALQRGVDWACRNLVARTRGSTFGQSLARAQRRS